jgi:hypothetical protein
VRYTCDVVSKTCDCADFVFYHSDIEHSMCKHVKAIRSWCTS